MNYKTIHDTITENELNGVLYLLRKFTYYSEIISAYNVTVGEYATYTVTKGENDTLNIIISDAKRKNCYYSINNESVFVGDNGTGTINIPSTSNDLEVKLTYMGIIEEEITSDVYTLTLVASSNNVTVGDTVTYTATLLKNNVPMEDESIMFYIGGVYSMGTTNSNGVVTKTYTPSTVGTLSASASYTYAGSDTVNVTVNKYSSSLSLAESSSTITLGDSVTLSGALSTHDSSNKPIKIYQNSVLVTTINTDSSGNYSTSITPSNAGTFRYKAAYVGDSLQSNTESSVVIITVNQAPTYTLSLVASASEFMTGDSVSFTATLKENGVAVSGETLGYTIKHGTTTITSGTTSATDSNGEATISYTGTGAGDLTVSVSYGSLLQETCELIDAIYYDNATSDQSSNYYFNPAGGTTLTYSNGYYVLGLGTSSNYVQLMSLTDNIKGKTINFDVDLVLDGASTRTEVYVDNTRVAYSPYSTTNGTLSIQNVSIPSTATSVFFRIARRYTNDGDSIKFKNFVVYPI